MSAPDHPRPGLRERKKARIRAEIRAQAMRLFADQGYAATTTEQIAAAADVSPSTFFRFFSTKERLVLADDLEETMLAALAEQPAGLPLLTAFLQAVRTGLSRTERQSEAQRRALIAEIPSLRQAQSDELDRVITRLARSLLTRTGRPTSDFESHIFLGALTGTLHAALQRPSPTGDTLAQALAYLESGFPLASLQSAAGPGKSEV
ncbi:TetR/AcrR family transcriptional regulator [Paractinoplanes atraurantiacus]|uniref:Regulatory protein, tetR family n=1 Tax=Paractinoplanes atraurantiacus TaxID=1036182 RepID=A0A285JNG8_9ACTN|nr:TetR/AcrR family transcriptional regulator [Actinoplanes atraurantiacus]SNY61798.1 regulatory protein, tetR family [Actinoplanes atraurantiacus]